MKWVKDLQSPWLPSGIKKSSKRKQRLYEKFLKTRNQKKYIKTIKIYLRQQKIVQRSCIFKIDY